MAAVLAFALRRTSARVVLAAGFVGILWTVGLAQPYRVPMTTRMPVAVPRGTYRVLGLGFSALDVATAALVAALALVVAATLWRGLSLRR